MRRVLHGIANQVYELPDGAGVYKVAGPSFPGGYRSLAREAAACTFLAAHLPGVAPRVLCDDLPHSVTFSFIGGVPLPDIRPRLSGSQRERIASSAGQVLGQVHSLPTGNAPVELRWPNEGCTWADRALAYFEHVARAIEQAHPALHGLLSSCRRRLAADRRCLGEPEGRLIHGDFVGGNLLAEPAGAAIAGAVDWEWAALADPDIDLARLHWLPKVGRRPSLWTNQREEAAFLDAYAAYRPPSQFRAKLRWYGTWLAAQYLGARLHWGLTNDCDPFISYLTREVN